jgi:predicted nucleic acid-binding protein
MEVLVDTNIIVDFLITREPFFEVSSKIIAKCANGELSGYIAFHSIPNLWYILRKVPEDKRREWLIDICGFLRVAGANHDEVLKALRKAEFKDFEDCLQDKCAKSVGAEYIITRNVADFSEAEVPAISPEDFLATVQG